MSWPEPPRQAARVFGNRARAGPTNVDDDLFGPSRPISRTTSASSKSEVDENPFMMDSIRSAAETRERGALKGSDVNMDHSSLQLGVKTKRKAKEEGQDQKKTRARAQSPQPAAQHSGVPSPFGGGQHVGGAAAFSFSASDVSTLGSTFPSR